MNSTLTIYYTDSDLAEQSVEVVPTDESYALRELMGEDLVLLRFSLNRAIDFPVGAYIIYEGVKYVLMTPENWIRHGLYNIEYQMTFSGPQSMFERFILRNPRDGRVKFSMIAGPAEFVNLIIENLHQRGLEDWESEVLIDASNQSVEFNQVSLLDAIKLISLSFETEYEISRDNKVILGKIEYYKDAPVVLSYGKGNGFKPGTARTNTNSSSTNSAISKGTSPIDILYVQGGSRNIDARTYGSETLHLPKGKSITYEGKTYLSSANGAYLYVEGLSNARLNKAAKQNEQIKLLPPSEGNLELSEIYPRRTGVVSRVYAVDDEKGLYDFSDASIPESLDYNDYLIPGEAMTVIFQKGMLAGRDFDVSRYEHSRRRFELVPIEQSGRIMPSGPFIPAPTDTYIITGCTLPQAYIADDLTRTGAEYELLQEAARHLYESANQPFTFKGELDSIWLKAQSATLREKFRMGAYIAFSDGQFQPTPIPLRIVSTKQFITRPDDLELELSEAAVAPSAISSAISELPRQEIRFERSITSTTNYAKRAFRSAKQSISQLEGAVEGFTGSVSPIAVNTMALLVGDEFLQFGFYDVSERVNGSVKVINSSSATRIEPYVHYDSASKTFIFAKEQDSDQNLILVHYTLGNNQLSPNNNGSYSRYWSIPMLNGRLDDTTQGYYLYAKVEANSVSSVPQGTFELLSEIVSNPMNAEVHGGWYYLLVGILTAEDATGERTFTSLYGFTEISGGRVTTDRVVSSDGQSYFDLVQDRFKLGDTLRFENNTLEIKGDLVQRSATRSVPIYKNSQDKPAAPIGNSFPPSGWRETVDNILNEAYSIRAGTPQVSESSNHKISITAGREAISFGRNNTNINNADLSKDNLRVNNGNIALRIEFTTYEPNEVLDFLLESKFNDSMEARGWLGLLDDDTILEYADVEDYASIAVGGLGNNQREYYRLLVPSIGRHFVNIWLTFNPIITEAISPQTITYQILNTQYPIWISYAEVAENSTILSWTEPQLYEGQKDAVVMFQGDWQYGKAYYGIQSRRDVVLWQDAYYIVKKGVGVFSDIRPDDKTHWEAFGASFQSLATGLLLAEEAYIENLYTRHLRTRLDGGKGIEAKENQLWAFGDDGMPNLVISGEQISSQSEQFYDIHAQSISLQANVNQRLTQSGSKTLVSRIEAKAGSMLSFAREISINCWARIAGNVLPTAELAPDLPSDLGAKAVGKFVLCLQDLAGNLVYKFDNKNVGAFENGAHDTETMVIPSGTRLALAAGTYDLVVRYDVDLRGYGNEVGPLRMDNAERQILLTASAGFQSTLEASNVVSVYQDQRLTQIGANGLSVAFAQDMYAEFMEKESGVEVNLTIGLNGLRIGENGIFMKLGGADWKRLDYVPTTGALRLVNG